MYLNVTQYLPSTSLSSYSWSYSGTNDESFHTLIKRHYSKCCVHTVFQVSFGPPAHIYCVYNKIVAILHTQDDPNLSREVIRSQYVNSSQPDMTRVTVKVEQPREERT